MAKPVLVTKRRPPEAAQTTRPATPLVARAVPNVATSAPAPSLSDSERYALISLCAYFRAEQRGFEPGHMWDDWLAAEEEVAARNARGNDRSEQKP